MKLICSKFFRPLAALGAKSGFVLLVVTLSASLCFADAPPEEQFREKVGIPNEPITREPAPAPVAAKTGCGTRFSLGVTEAFFDDEDAETLPALHLDFFCPDEAPLNLRVGFEGSNHINLHQDAAASVGEFPGATPQVTFVRIPFSLEYVVPLADQYRLYIGGGPDIIHTANDVGETSVGLHLGSRLGYDFDDNWGVSLEAGYWWAEVDGNDEDINFDSAYVTPQLTYTF